MVNVAIDSHGSADFVIALHAAYGDRHVVDHAEALTMVGEGVMKSAADVEGDSILQRILSRQDGPARRYPEGLHQFRRVGNLHLHFFKRRERAVFQLVHILRLVYQQDVFVRGGLGSEEICGFRDFRFQEPPMHKPVLFSRKDVRANGEVVIVTVHESEGEHDDRSSMILAEGLPALNESPFKPARVAYFARWCAGRAYKAQSRDL